jgi:VanZ family protein
MTRREIAASPATPPGRRAWFIAGWVQVVVLVVLCLLPLERMPGPDLTWTDKLYHAGAFALLMWWFAVAQATRSHRWSALLLLLLGIAIEFAQGFVPLRAPSGGDAVADGLGVLLGWLAARATPRALPAWRPPH